MAKDDPWWEGARERVKLTTCKQRKVNSKLGTLGAFLAEEVDPAIFHSRPRRWRDIRKFFGGTTAEKGVQCDWCNPRLAQQTRVPVLTTFWVSQRSSNDAMLRRGQALGRRQVKPAICSRYMFCARPDNRRRTNYVARTIDLLDLLPPVLLRFSGNKRLYDKNTHIYGPKVLRPQLLIPINLFFVFLFRGPYLTS